MDRLLENMGSFKVYLSNRCQMVKRVVALAEGLPYCELDSQNVTVSSVDVDHQPEQQRPLTVRKKEDVREVTEEMMERIKRNIEAKNDNTSGLEWAQSLGMTLHASKIVGMRVGKWERNLKKIAPVQEEEVQRIIELAGLWMRLPQHLKGRRVFNPKPYSPASDQRCFMWTILRGLHPLEKGVRNSGTNIKDLIGKENEVVLPEGVTYPIALDNAQLFKIQECNTFSFSIFDVTTATIQPVYVSPLRGKKAFHFLLGLIRSEGGSHFILLGERRDEPLGKVMPFCHSKNRRVYYCEGCLHASRTLHARDVHEDECDHVQVLGRLSNSDLQEERRTQNRLVG